MGNKMNNSFEGLKNQISTFCRCADGFKIICCPVMEKVNTVFCFYTFLGAFLTADIYEFEIRITFCVFYIHIDFFST